MLNPTIEVAFDDLQNKLLLASGSDFTSISKSTMYGELSAELSGLRDKYRTLADKKDSAPSAGTPGAEKDSSNKSTQSVVDKFKNVKSQIILTSCDEGIIVEAKNIRNSSQYAYFIDSLVKCALGSNCDTTEIITGISMAAANIKEPIYKQALIIALMAERDGHLCN